MEYVRIYSYKYKYNKKLQCCRHNIFFTYILWLYY